MAKRPSSRSQADDAASGATSPPRPRRARPPKAADASGAPIPAIDRDPGERPESLDALRSEPAAPSAVDPSEEEIRTRAYHRYLERGGGHGNDFQDWLEAEKDLKGRR